MSRPLVRLVDDVTDAPGVVMDEVAPAPHDLEGRTVRGTITNADDAHRALDCASRGAALVLHVTLVGRDRDEFFDHLARLADMIEDSAQPAQRDGSSVLLRELRRGSSLDDAAHAAGMSRRTAARRLKELRDAYGVGSVAELLAVADD